MYAKPTKEKGPLLTQPFKVNGKELFLNLDAEGRELSIEILSLNGTPLAIFTNICGNHTAIQIQWKEGKLAELRGQKAYLRINLRQTQLYSYWFD